MVRKIIAAALLCACSSVFAQTTVLDFDGPFFVPADLLAGFSYHQDGYTVRSVATFYGDPPPIAGGDVFFPAGSEITSCYPNIGLPCKFEVFQDLDATFSFVSLDALSHSSDLCMQEHLFGLTDAVGLTVMGSLAGVAQYTQYLPVHCTAGKVTIVNPFAGIPIDLLQVSTPDLNFIVVDNVAVAVPEPETYALMLAGLALVLRRAHTRAERKYAWTS